MKYGLTWTYINANSIGGYKFNEIEAWLLSGRLDILIISETKIDSTFPSSLCHVEGFCLCRCNRKAGGARGGYSHTLPIRVCAAQRGRDFEAPDLERGIHFTGVF